MNFDVQWPLVLFGLLCGLGGTLAATCGVAQLAGKAKQGGFVASITALVLMVVGGLAVTAHLTLPLHAFYAVTNLLSFSGISVELMALAVAFVCVLAFAILLKRSKNETPLRVFAVLMIVSGLVLAFVCGHGYVIEARELWDTDLLPCAYLGTVMPAGAFLYVAIAVKKGAAPDEVKCRALSVYTCVSVALSVIFSIAYLAFLGADVLARNPFVSYGLVVLFGIVGTIACLAVYLRTDDAKVIFVVAVAGCVLALLGGLGIRMEMWIASDPYFYSFYYELENGTPILTDDY